MPDAKGRPTRAEKLSTANAVCDALRAVGHTRRTVEPRSEPNLEERAAAVIQTLLGMIPDDDTVEQARSAVDALIMDCT